MASGLPLSAADIKAVWSSSEVLFGSTPAVSKRSTIGALPASAASASGVIL